MSPRLIRLLAIAGAVIVLIGGGLFVGFRLVTNRVNGAIPQADLFGDETPSATPGASPVAPSPSPLPGGDIKGPLNILIVGIDTRESRPGWTPGADAIMILHVNKDLSQAYLTSLPRDLVLTAPAFGPSNYGGGRARLTDVMRFGSRVPGSNRRNPAQGFQLVARTVSRYTGIARWDAGAMLTFSGLYRLVDAFGGIDMYIDQRVVSIHRMPNGEHRPPCSSCEHNYSGPRAVYDVGMRHLRGWQALDYARQRYISGGDYARQRHQRQMIKAIVVKAMAGDVLKNPVRFNQVLVRLGKTLIFDGRGRKPVEFGFALRNLKASAITLVGLPGGSIFNGGQYGGESLNSTTQSSYFAAVRADKVDAWVSSHRNLVNTDPR